MAGCHGLSLAPVWFGNQAVDIVGVLDSTIPVQKCTYIYIEGIGTYCKGVSVRVTRRETAEKSVRVGIARPHQFQLSRSTLIPSTHRTDGLHWEDYTARPAARSILSRRLEATNFNGQITRQAMRWLGHIQ